MSKLHGLLVFFAALLGCAASFTSAQVVQPEGASGYVPKTGWTTSKFAIATANPLATEAGNQILKAGGSAVDAAIAVQMVLGLVEPQSSGIGGGSFMLHFEANKQCKSTTQDVPCGLQAYDGRETAPSRATKDLFLGSNGKPMAFTDAVVGGRSVGVMGTIKMLEQAYKQHGHLPWSALFQPAIDLATKGFPISPRMNALLQSETELKKDTVTAAYFYDHQGQPWQVGHLLKNPEYAAVLKLIAKDGSNAFYTGEIAQAIAQKIRSHPTNPGTLSTADLAGYQAKERPPFCTDYTAGKDAKTYVICGMPPPSSGAIAIVEILGVLEVLNQTQIRAASLRGNIPSANWLHVYTEAARLALADRAQYVADPDYIPPPAGDWKSLVSPEYLATRAKLIGEQTMRTADPGIPVGAKTAYAPMPHQPEHGTSHISIIDAYGNALAMTSSIENAWGSRQMVNRSKLDANGQPMLGGFLLNNELTDFSFLPTSADGKPIANRVAPGKRPRSAMSPTLVFDKATGQVLSSLGSPGGEFIIHFNTKTLYGMLNWDLNVQQAIDLPNFGTFNNSTLLEKNRFPENIIKDLKRRGHEVLEIPLTSGIQGIQKTSTGFLGGADPRREGTVLGE